MYRLESSNVIDILGKDCKNNKHKHCNGNWAGLGFRVDCNCECHHQQQNKSDIEKEMFEATFDNFNGTVGKAAKNHFQSKGESKFKDLRNKNFRDDKSFRGSNQHESIALGDD